MPLAPFFPATVERSNGAQWEVQLGWELSGLLAAPLVLADLVHNPLKASDQDWILWRKLAENRAAFAHGLCQWPSSVAVELHLSSLPNLAQQLRGTLHYCLLLRVVAESRQAAMELALNHCTELRALVNSCFPEAEFSPVKDSQKLMMLARPFQPNSIVHLTRQHYLLDLAQPLVRKSVGFTAKSEASGPANWTVACTSTWAPRYDSQERLIRFLLWQTQPVWITVKVRAAADSEMEKDRLLNLVQNCDAHLSGSTEAKTVHAPSLMLIREQAFERLLALERGGLQMAVLVQTLQQPPKTLLSLLGHSITQAPGGDKGKDLLTGGFSQQLIETEVGQNPWWFPHDDVYTPEEVAAALRLPTPPQSELPGMPVKKFRSGFALLPPSFADQTGASLLGYNLHRGVRQPVYCRVQDRMRHMFILGMTGSGKSTFMENLIMQDIRNGDGLCLIDPHGDQILKILQKVPKSREQDVIVLDPLDSQYPIGFNLLEYKTTEERDIIIDSLYQALDQMYDMRQTGGPIFENNFRNMMKLLMGDRPRQAFTPTILEFPALYLHEAFRKWLADTMEDQQVRDFVDELERTGGEVSLQNLAPYITSKFGRFVSDSILRRMVGQEKTAFDFGEIINSGKILLINLGRGRFGATVSSLLAAQIVGRLKNAAMQRATLPDARRKPFFLYVDEFQNLPSEEFSELLAEARKYKLGLVLANQFADQLDRAHPGQQSVLKSILGNVGIFVIFRLGIEDARRLSPIFYPTFSENDVKELPNWQAYVQLRAEGQVLSPFNIQTMLDETPLDKKSAMRIIRSTRAKYGRPVKQVDEEIQTRRSFFHGIN